MKPIHKAWMIPLDITTYCTHRCAHCTRAVRHNSGSPMNLKQIKYAIDTLIEQGWKGNIGLIGGEPTIHPDFYLICRKLMDLPKHRCSLFTSGGRKYDDYKLIIKNTFGVINYNDHSTPSYHQPLMVAGSDIIHNESYREKCIDRCWLQHQWCPCINENGAYFCEVAGVIDRFFGGKHAYDIDTKWWNKKPKDFEDQRNALCRYCGIPYPMPPIIDTAKREFISEEWIEILLNNKAFREKSKYIIIDKEMYDNHMANVKYWKPQEYAQKKTNHHWVKTDIRPWLRNKWNSLPYWLLRKFIWK